SRLAEGSPATALAVNMHLHGVGLLAEGFRDRVEPFLKLVATDGAILAGGFSEPQSGGNWWYQASTATPLPGGGWRLAGTKTFFTRRAAVGHKAVLPGLPAGHPPVPVGGGGDRERPGADRLPGPAARAGGAGPGRLEGDGDGGHREPRPGHRKSER